MPRCNVCPPWLHTQIHRLLLIACPQVDDTGFITPCIDNLAKVLVENLTGRSGNPELAWLADRLLHSMVTRFPQLLWSAPVIQALLVELQREEGALYLTGGKPRLTLARVLRIRRKKKKVPLPAWTWLIKVQFAKQPASCKFAHVQLDMQGLLKITCYFQHTSKLQLGF